MEGGQGQSGQTIKLFQITPYVNDFQVDPFAAEFGRRRRILCVSRKSADKKFGQAGAAEYKFVQRV